MAVSQAPEKHGPRVLVLKAGLLTIWAALTFGVCFFARDLQFMVGHWPFGYWMAAQGVVLAFIAIVTVYAWAMTYLAPEDSRPSAETGDA